MTTVNRGSAPTHPTYYVTPDVLHHILGYAFDTSGEMSRALGRWGEVKR